MNKNVLKAVLAEKGMTQKELSKMLGIGECTLSRRIKANGVNFTLKDIETFVEIFGRKKVDEIFFS